MSGVSGAIIGDFQNVPAINRTGATAKFTAQGGRAKVVRPRPIDDQVGVRVRRN